MEWMKKKRTKERKRDGTKRECERGMWRKISGGIMEQEETTGTDMGEWRQWKRKGKGQECEGSQTKGLREGKKRGERERKDVRKERKKESRESDREERKMQRRRNVKERR